MRVNRLLEDILRNFVPHDLLCKLRVFHPGRTPPRCTWRPPKVHSWCCRNLDAKLAGSLDPVALDQSSVIAQKKRKDKTSPLRMECIPPLHFHLRCWYVQLYSHTPRGQQIPIQVLLCLRGTPCIHCSPVYLDMFLGHSVCSFCWRSNLDTVPLGRVGNLRRQQKAAPSRWGKACRRASHQSYLWDDLNRTPNRKLDRSSGWDLPYLQQTLRFSHCL